MAKNPDLPPVEEGRFLRVVIGFFMQIMAVSIVGYRMYDSGLHHIIDTYIAARSPWTSSCGLLPHKEFVILSDRIVSPYGIFPGYIHVRGSRIADTSLGGVSSDRHRLAEHLISSRPELAVVDYGAFVVGPGLVDTHVHMNEPGREDWEGMATATRAAAAGGITTLVDMPLNSDPCTTTVAELRRKISIAAHSPNKTYVDVAFWAGLVPENAHKPEVLKALIAAGAVGFKTFMSPSGIDDFPNVSVEDIRAALPVLKALGVPLLVHAELVDDEAAEAVQGLPSRKHATWVTSRPPRFEQNAVKALIAALKDVMKEESDKKSGGDPVPFGFSVHVVHISDSKTLQLLVEARSRGLPISAETGPHYLLFASDDVKDGDTRFKCAPPLRSAENRAALLAALAAGQFDSLGTDHSPAPPSMKSLDTGDFMASWGGIAGLQYALPATWTALQRANATGSSASQLHSLFSRFPATLASLGKKKGSLKMMFDADIVVWDPEALADTSISALQHRHKVTPYQDQKLKGKVVATFVRGSQVFSDEQGVAKEACGRVLLRHTKKKVPFWISWLIRI